MPVLNTTDYALTVSDQIKEFLKTAQYGDLFQYFFYGNPEEGIPSNQCPCVVVVKEDAEISQGPTGMDFISENILIRVVLSKREFLEEGPSDEVLTQREFEQLCQGIDATTGLYTANSIVGILRNNFTLSQTVTNQTIKVSYGKVMNPVVDEITREAQIKVFAEYYIMTPNKQ